LDRLDLDRVDVLRDPPDLVDVLRDPPDLVVDELRFDAGLLELRERLVLDPPAPLRLRLGDARFVPFAAEDRVRLLALFEPLLLLVEPLLLVELLLRVEPLLLVEPLLPLALFFRLLVLVVVVAIVSLLGCQFRELDLREPLAFGLEPFRLFDELLLDREPPEDLRSVLLLTSPSSIVPRQPPSSASSSISAWALNRCRSPRTARLVKRIPRPIFSRRLSGWTSSVTSSRVNRGASSWNVTTPV
jgi:hypothetical protein